MPKHVRVWPNDCGPTEANLCRGYRTEVLTLDILPWRRFPPGTSRMFSWKRAIEPLLCPKTECLSTQAVYHLKGDRRFLSTLKGWSFRAAHSVKRRKPIQGGGFHTATAAGECLW
jgi:hypothetical protein